MHPSWDEKETERAALLEQAAGIVRAVAAESRAPSEAEDDLILQLMARVRALEAEIGHLKRQLRRI
jgi:hypothetical protein